MEIECIVKRFKNSLTDAERSEAFRDLYDIVKHPMKRALSRFHIESIYKTLCKKDYNFTVALAVQIAKCRAKDVTAHGGGISESPVKLSQARTKPIEEYGSEYDPLQILIQKEEAELNLTRTEHHGTFKMPTVIYPKPINRYEKAVMHKNTGTIYPSVYEAAKQFPKASKISIVNAIKYNMICAGSKWSWV
jgi:hypothetical protein